MMLYSIRRNFLEKQNWNFFNFQFAHQILYCKSCKTFTSAKYKRLTTKNILSAYWESFSQLKNLVTFPSSQIRFLSNSQGNFRFGIVRSRTSNKECLCMCVCLFGYNFDGNTDNIHSKVEVSSAINTLLYMPEIPLMQTKKINVSSLVFLIYPEKIVLFMTNYFMITQIHHFVQSNIKLSLCLKKRNC